MKFSDHSYDLFLDLKTLAMLVKICIEDNEQCSLITFNSLQRPLDTMKKVMVTTNDGKEFRSVQTGHH